MLFMLRGRLKKRSSFFSHNLTSLYSCDVVNMKVTTGKHVSPGIASLAGVWVNNALPSTWACTVVSFLVHAGKGRCLIPGGGGIRKMVFNGKTVYKKGPYYL